MVEVVAALIIKDNKFLICQRPENKARGLLWEFVGGKVEPGESREQALKRECREELDVGIIVEDEFAQVVHAYSDVTIRLTLFKARIVEGVPKMLEHKDMKWITKDEIERYKFCPADVDILKKIKSSYALFSKQIKTKYNI